MIVVLVGSLVVFFVLFVCLIWWCEGRGKPLVKVWWLICFTDAEFFLGKKPLLLLRELEVCVVLWRTLGSCPGLQRSDLESAEYPLASLSLSLSLERACMCLVCMCQRLGSGGGDEKHLCGVLSSVDMCL